LKSVFARRHCALRESHGIVASIIEPPAVLVEILV
jgi:hypothetical protein